jgi:hypothetical protein
MTDLELLHEGEGFLGSALPLQLLALQAGAQVVTFPPLGNQRYREIATLFSVTNAKQEFHADEK